MILRRREMWEDNKNFDLYCNNCQSPIYNEQYDFCPWCGGKFDKGNDIIYEYEPENENEEEDWL